MAVAARSVLGLPSSSTSVERLFSGAGNVTDSHRGSLSSKALSEQTSVKYWLRTFKDAPVVEKLDKGKGKMAAEEDILVLD